MKIDDFCRIVYHLKYSINKLHGSARIEIHMDSVTKNLLADEARYSPSAPVNFSRPYGMDCVGVSIKEIGSPFTFDQFQKAYSDTHGVCKTQEELRKFFNLANELGIRK